MSWITEAPQLTLLAAIFAIFAAAAALTVIAAWRSHRTLALFGMLLSGAVVYGAGYRIALPALEPFWISEKASAAAHWLEGCGKGPAGFAGLNEMSLVFQNGTDTLLTTPNALADALASNQVRVAFVSWKNGHEFEQAFSQRVGHGPEFFGCVDGFDINGQGPVRLQGYVRPDVVNRPGCAPTPAMACRPKTAVRWRRLLDTTF